MFLMSSISCWGAGSGSHRYRRLGGLEILRGCLQCLWLFNRGVCAACCTVVVGVGDTASDVKPAVPVVSEGLNPVVDVGDVVVFPSVVVGLVVAVPDVVVAPAPSP